MSSAPPCTATPERAIVGTLKSGQPPLVTMARAPKTMASAKVPIEENV
jgi:hypothetical protein